MNISATTFVSQNDTRVNALVSVSKSDSSADLKNQQTQTLRAKAPAKIILSGEHSVVYGASAIAVAVQRHTQVSFTSVSQSKTINTLFSGISSSVSYPINALSKLKHTLDARFDGYTKGELPVQNILNHPNDLAMYALSNLMQHLPSRKSISDLLPKSGILRSESTIPLGAGMGSSASAIAATLVLYEDILKKEMSHEQRYEMVRFCERLQHGNGSAIDAVTVTFGGINYIYQSNDGSQQTQHKHIKQELGDDWYWLYTGIPQNSTGECVSYVRKRHAKDFVLWEEFDGVTNALYNLLETPTHTEDVISMTKTIAQNHELLTEIGVVSDTAQQVVDFIKEQGGAAKVSGAGTVSGERNGLLLAYLPKQSFSHERVNNLITAINLQFNNYVKDWGSVLVDNDGAVRV